MGNERTVCRGAQQPEYGCLTLWSVSRQCLLGKGTANATAVLVELCVSVTFAVDMAGGVTCWFTRESGCTLCCGACDRCSGSSSEETTTAYVAIAVGSATDGCEEVHMVFAQLRYEVLVAVMHHVLYAFSVQLQAAMQGRGGVSVEKAMRELDSGMFSSGSGCGCGAGRGICTACRSVCVRARMFVRQGRYLGWHPRGREHWWTGVTDAAGEVGGLPWMRCDTAEVQRRVALEDAKSSEVIAECLIDAESG